MKKVGLFERKAQVLIAVLIAFTIILTLGAAILMHSRSERASVKLENDAQKAYSIAQSGLNIAAPGTYNIGGGTVEVKDDGTKITAIAKFQGSEQTLTKPSSFTPPPEATTWAKAYGGSNVDEGYFVAETPGASDAGYVLGGLTQSYGAGGSDILLVKINDQGDKTWANAYGGSGDIMLQVEANIAKAPINGGYVAVCADNSFSSKGSGYDALMVKVATNGDLQWAKGYIASGLELPRAVIETSDGGYLFAMQASGWKSVEGPSMLGSAIVVIKTDSQGRIGAGSGPQATWAKFYDNQASNTNEYPVSIAEASANYVISGYRNHVDTDGEVLAVNKGTGVIIWQKHYGTPKPGDEFFTSIFPVTDVGYVVTGQTDAYGPVGRGKNCFFAKLDLNGNQLGVAEVFDETLLLDQRGQKIKATSTGSGYALGARSMEGTNCDFLMIKTDNNGNSVKSKAYGGSAYDHLCSLDVTTLDDGLILGGYTNGYGAGGNDFLIIKTDGDGELSCAPNISRNPSGFSETPFSLNEIVGYPLTALTPTLDDVEVGPTGQGKINKNSADAIVVTSVCFTSG